MSDRPQPHLSRWGELVVPPEDLAELAAWLTELVEVRGGRGRPGAVRQPRVTAKLALYRALAERGARMVAAARAVSGAPTARAAPVVAAVQTEAGSGEEITVAEAAALAGRSRERMRQLAASGKVRARLVARSAWLLDRGDVIAMTTGRSTADGAGGSEEHGDDGPDPGGQAGGSAAGRGAAA